MEKYILGENIITTTRERYERTFKRLGYKPYKAPVKKEKAEEKVEEEKITEKKKINKEK